MVLLRSDLRTLLQISLASNQWIPSAGGFEGAANSSAGYAAIPQELLPYSAQEVLLDRPPTAGFWRAGQRVSATNVTAAGAVAWVCVEPGEPGVWRPLFPLAGP